MRIQNFWVALIALGCCLGVSGLAPVTDVLGSSVEPPRQDFTDGVNAKEALGNDFEDLEQAGRTPSMEDLESRIAMEREILQKKVAVSTRAAERNKKLLIGTSIAFGTLAVIGLLLGGRSLYKRRQESNEGTLLSSLASGANRFRSFFSRKSPAEGNPAEDDDTT